MCFSHAKGHMSILYVSCMKFPTNQFVGNFYPIYNESNLKPLILVRRKK